MLTAKITTTIVGSLENELDLVTASAPISKRYEQSYADGTGADQAEELFSDTRSLAASASESLDLAGGLASPLGGSITFTAIKEIIVRASPDNTGDLRVGAAIANAFQGPFGAAAVGNLVPPDGILHLRNPSAAGWPVTAGTGDLLQIENLVAAAQSYDIIIIGEGSAA